MLEDLPEGEHYFFNPLAFGVLNLFIVRNFHKSTVTLLPIEDVFKKGISTARRYFRNDYRKGFMGVATVGGLGIGWSTYRLNMRSQDISRDLGLRKEVLEQLKEARERRDEGLNIMREAKGFFVRIQRLIRAGRIYI